MATSLSSSLIAELPAYINIFISQQLKFGIKNIVSVFKNLLVIPEFVVGITSKASTFFGIAINYYYML